MDEKPLSFILQLWHPNHPDLANLILQIDSFGSSLQSIRLLCPVHLPESYASVELQVSRLHLFYPLHSVISIAIFFLIFPDNTRADIYF
jgi:hypothetical protein